MVYHVQTEDKGLDSPLILSLVYSGGEILAAKRTTYDDLIAAGFDDEVLSERLKRQHRLICAAIKAGRIDELKRMSARPEEGTPAASKPATDVEQAQVAPVDPVDIEQQAMDEEFVIEMDAEIRSRPMEIHEEFIIETAAERPPVADWPPRVEEELVIEPFSAPPISEPQITPELPPASVVPQESVYTVYDSRGPSRRGVSRKPQGDLVLTILNEEEFRAGETVTIRVLLQYCSGNSEKALGGVPLSVKVLGTTFRPRIYHVNTQRDGVGIISVEIPPFTSGRAAVLIRAEAHDQSTELRRAIQPAE